MERLMLLEISIILAIRFWPRILAEREKERVREKSRGWGRPQGQAKGGAKYSSVTLFHLQRRGKMQMVALFCAVERTVSSWWRKGAARRRVEISKCRWCLSMPLLHLGRR